MIKEYDAKFSNLNANFEKKIEFNENIVNETYEKIFDLEKKLNE